jgi:ribosomal 50S subunit-associated protein YjgA (DUF615 family)
VSIWLVAPGRELIYETNRDVKWICRMLARMEAQDEEFEARLRALEGWRDCGRGGGDAWWGVKEIVRVLGGG